MCLVLTFNFPSLALPELFLKNKQTGYKDPDEFFAGLICPNQARVWNLLNKSKIYQKIVQHPKVMRIIDDILGDDFQLGSVATNTLFPGLNPRWRLLTFCVVVQDFTSGKISGCQNQCSFIASRNMGFWLHFRLNWSGTTH